MALGRDTNAYGQIRGCLLPLIQGRVVAVDPSIGSTSSQPGFAVYIQGELRASGILPIDPGLPVWERLRILVYHMRKLYREWDPDVLVFEDIPSQRHGQFNNAGNANAHASLLKAVGAILSVSGPDHYVGLHPQSWKRMVRPDYVKSDTRDAVEMGWIAIEEAKRIGEIDPPGKRETRSRGKAGKGQARASAQRRVAAAEPIR
jgi:hypothetical protein